MRTSSALRVFKNSMRGQRQWPTKLTEDNMTKEYLVTFEIEGIGGGSSYLSVEDGKVSTQSVEDEFYATLRKNEKKILEESESEEKSELIDSLTPAQEEKLKTAHMAQYRGTDDDSPDDYEDWLCNTVSLEEIKEILK